MPKIRETAYLKYQLAWMLGNGHSLQDLMSELFQKQYEDPEDRYALSRPVTDVFSEWEKETGFGGSLWVCYEEF